MKILIIQENGRHLENRKYRECHNFKRAFDRLGYESVVWGLGHENFTESFEDLYKECGVILILENYEEKNWIPDLSSAKKLKIFWSIDSHCNPDGNISTATRHNVNIVLCSIESDQNLFPNAKTFYFPNAYPSDLIVPLDDVEKTTFIGFCGTPFDSRVDLMNHIEKNTIFQIQRNTWTLGDAMVRSINSYKIHFNHSENNDINYRVFETLGTKTCLLTSKNENLNTFFTDMEDLVMYTGKDELLDKVIYLSQNLDKIDRIAESGYQKVLKSHTYDSRALELLKIIQENI